MMQSLSLPKTIVTTLAFVLLVYGSAHAQSPANPPAQQTTTPSQQTTPAQVGAPPVPLADITPQAPTTSQSNENAVVLLDRVETIVDEAMGDKPKKKVEKNNGQVTIDRADLDEIRAAVGQLKIALESYGPAKPAAPTTSNP
jgi:hypothetical protein